MPRLRNVTTIAELSLCLQALFNILNEELFENKLEKCVITCKEGQKANAYGWITTAKVWNQNQIERHEINISCEYLNRSKEEIAGTMLHEMCHLYAIQNNIKDTSRSGIYHNERYKEIAINHCLNVKFYEKVGHAVTELNDKGKEIIKKWNVNEIKLYKKEEEKKEKKTKKKSSTRKYICPCCQNSVRATKQVNIICMDCNKQMLTEEELNEM